MINPRRKLRQVMQRAALVDLGPLQDTELLRGSGKRQSPRRSYTGLGKTEAIVKWTPDYPYSAVNWGMSARTSPIEKVVVKRTKLIATDWLILNDASKTMDFATEGDLKLVTGAVLVAIFGEAAVKRRDRVSQIVYDEKGNAPVLENASAEEMVLLTLSHDRTKTRAFGGIASSSKRSGLSSALSYAPENQAIIPIISDFMNLTKADEVALVRAARYHTVLCCVVEDPREAGFPNVSGQVSMQDMKSGRQHTMTFAQANKLVAADRAKRKERLDALFKRARCRHALFRTNDQPRVLRKKVAALLRLGA